MIQIPINLDITKPYRTPITINQLDTDEPVFLFTLRNNGALVDLTGTTVVFYAEKPDGTVLYNACDVTDATKGKCTYTVTSQTSAVVGTLKCQIVVTFASGAEKRSQEFSVTVEPSLDITGAIESTSEFTALQQALTQTTGFDARITQNESDITQNASDIDALAPVYSLEKSANGLHLVNDESSPANGTYYGVVNNVRGYYPIREFLAVTKSTNQSISANTVTNVTWDTVETIGSSFAAFGTNRIDIIADCYGYPELVLTADDVSSGDVVSAILYLNGNYIAQSYFFGGANYDRVTAIAHVQLPLALNAGDYLEAKIYTSGACTLVYTTSQTFFALETWSR